jgi:glutamate racemase
MRIYLDELRAEARAQGLDADTLVLGCTHYPLLRPVIEETLASKAGRAMRVIDSAESTAEAAVKLFNTSEGAGFPGFENPDLHPTDEDPSAGTPDPGHPEETEIRCFATDSVEKFERLGSRFLGRPVGRVELVDLGG